MPTGYTASLADGTCKNFKEFAYRCARGMGGTMFMCDDSMDTPIPDKVPSVSTHHADELEKAQAELARLVNMTAKQQLQAYKDQYEEQITHYLERSDRMAEQGQRYADMLQKAKAYDNGPEGLRDFMVDQIENSMGYDIHDIEKPKDIGPVAWHEKAKKEAKWAVDYHREKISEESKRREEINAWLATLHASLRDY